MVPQQIWLILADNGLLQLHERKKCPSEVPTPCDFSHLQKPLLSLWKEDVEPWLMDRYLEQIICSFALFKISVSFLPWIYIWEVTSLLYHNATEFAEWRQNVQNGRQKSWDAMRKKSLSKVLIRLFLFLMFIFECQNSSDLNKLFFCPLY